MLKIATGYARKGWPVFPLRPQGKEPLAELAPHGLKDATTDLATVTEWWSLWPDANIGLVTGHASGLVVLDVDHETGGWATLENLEQRYGELAPTWAADTGGGGIHLYFQAPATEVRNSASVVGPGLDVRGEGGYVVAPPSRHPNGTRYRWGRGWHPTMVALQPIPEWLFLRMQAGRRDAPGRAAASPLPEVVTDGTRNVWLTSGAGTMRRRGFSVDAILAALLVENRSRCHPPLEEREVHAIARSVARYHPSSDSFTLGGNLILTGGPDHRSSSLTI